MRFSSLCVGFSSAAVLFCLIVPISTSGAERSQQVADFLKELRETGGQYVEEKDTPGDPVWSITLSHDRFPKSLASIRHIESLERLVILPDTHTTPLRNLDRLTEHLIHCRKLETAILYGQISERGLRNISKLNRLKKLVLYCSGKPVNISSIGALENLESLGLHNYFFDNDSIGSLIKCSKLKSVGLYHSTGAPKYLWSFCKSGSIRHLGLDYSEFDGTLFSKDYPFAKLTSLSLNGMNLVGDYLEAHQAIPNVEYISMFNTKIDDINAKKLHHLARLKRLRLSSPNLTVSGLRSVLESKSLRALDIAGFTKKDPKIKKLIQDHPMVEFYVSD